MSRLRPRLTLPVRPLVCLLLIAASLASLGLLPPGDSAAAPRDAIDAAAQAGLVRLSVYFQQNLNSGCTPRPGRANCAGSLSPDQNAGVLSAIRAALPPGFNTFDAFYVDGQGTRYGTNEVGGVYSVPFEDPGQRGVAGVQVRSTEGGTPGPFVTYTFAGLRTILHPPSDIWLPPSPTPLPPGPSGALRLAAPTSADQLTIWPLVLFTDTIQVGSVTALLPFTTTYTVNAWSRLCYSGYTGGGINCSGIDIEGWFNYGFDPSQGVALWLENMNDPMRGQGQVATYTSLPAGWDGTNADSTGAWMASPTGNVSQQSCLAMQRAGDQHQRVLLPIADRSNNLPDRKSVV